MAPDPNSSETTSSPSRGLWDRVASLRAALPSADIVEHWASSTRAAIERGDFQRDPELIARIVPLMEAFTKWFDAEVRGCEHFPSSGPVLLIGNHSGGTITPDTSALIPAWYRTRGFDSPLGLLTVDAMFGVPGFGVLCRKLGLVPASHEAGERVLRSGGSLLIYPGGAHEVFRPYAERNRIDFAGRRGFIKLALRTGVPVVPVVGHGAHESLYVVSRGEGLARRIGMDRLRLGIFPIIAQVPWGLSSPALVGVPLPVKITMQVCAPLDWARFGPDAAEDPAVLDRCYDEITTLMQDTLTRLAEEHPHPLRERLGSLLSRGSRR